MKISVIIPVYNRSSTIEYCLNSVLKQTYSPYEIIVVDDCSTDQTINKITSYKDKKIKIVSLDKKSGAQAARNKGISHSSGDWIAFQDSDDEWLVDKLQKQVSVIKNNNYDPYVAVHTNCYCCYPNGKRVKWELPIVNGDDVYNILLTRPSPTFPGMLVSKLALEKINYLDEDVPAYQEWETSIRLAKYCKFRHISEPLFLYHLDGNNNISRDNEKSVLGYEYIVEKHKDEIIRCCGYKIYNQHKLSNARRAIEKGFYNHAKKELNKVLYQGNYTRFMKLCANMHINPYFPFHIKDKIMRKINDRTYNS